MMNNQYQVFINIISRYGFFMMGASLSRTSGGIVAALLV